MILNKNHPKLRVLISGHLPPPFGGMATYYEMLLNSSLNDKIDYQFVQTSSQIREFARSGKFSISNIICAFQDCLRFSFAIIKFHPQIAHIGTAFGLSFLKHSCCVFIARFLGCVVLLHPHCSFQALYTEHSFLWKWFFRQVIRLSKNIVILSKEWLQISTILPNTQIFLLPNAINTKLYESAITKHFNEFNVDKPLKILYLGYIGKAKGSFDIIDASIILKLNECEMVIDLVGSELTPGELTLFKQRIEKADLKQIVRINQPVFGKEKIEFLKNADIFVYPSFHEGMPMAILEAMSCGLPIIATRVGGIPDLIQDGINGILIDPGDPNKLAQALIKLSNDHDLRYSFQKASYFTVIEKYNAEQHVCKLVNIYQIVLENFAHKK